MVAVHRRRGARDVTGGGVGINLAVQMRSGSDHLGRNRCVSIEPAAATCGTASSRISHRGDPSGAAVLHRSCSACCRAGTHAAGGPAWPGRTAAFGFGGARLPELEQFGLRTSRARQPQRPFELTCAPSRIGGLGYSPIASLALIKPVSGSVVVAASRCVAGDHGRWLPCRPRPTRSVGPRRKWLAQGKLRDPAVDRATRPN